MFSFSGRPRKAAQEFAMTRNAAAAAIALLMTTSSLAIAAETSPTVGVAPPSAADLKSLTDMRVGIVKAALQLTPDQEKYWPAIEDAIRARAKNRQARLERIAELHENGPMDGMHEGNPVEFMQRRADRLIQRGTDLKKLADAWEPLYKTLSDDQKRRMAFVSFAVMRSVRNAIEQRGGPEDEDE
ncbi:Spy/CpxP family protein refolding chaperone [Bradyrhizobium brasilense]|uniref:Spy/CpxP family protein refolding chaperone n=1 Tax=Bradyrhizobium brasilense TaxID=1419277 RepID=UPI001E2C0C93|nr:Spy/CpxP family protein refolding chaperone [Bradyrhizobium brasilense]